MGFRVELYIYDLSCGMARNLLPLLGLQGGGLLGPNFQLDGIWHTAIVVHGSEWFYGSMGIESCHPGGTMMGQPLKKEYLGETEVDLNSFRDYLHGLGQGQFQGRKYDLFNHNCNNFSNIVAQFLCGRTIPQYILDLPQMVLNSPLAGMVRPFLEQNLPHGTAMENNEDEFLMQTNQSTSPSSGATNSPKKELVSKSESKNVPEYVKFSSELANEKVYNKLKELNNQSESLKDENLEKLKKLMDQTLALDIKLWNDVFRPVLTKWPIEDTFPVLDIFRHYTSRLCPQTAILADFYKIVKDRQLISTDKPEPVVRLTLKILSNFFSFERSRSFMREHGEHCINEVQALIGSFSSGRDHIEISASTLAFNLALSIKQDPNQELSFLLTTSLIEKFLVEIKNYDALFRSIQAVNILVSSDQETKDLAMALDLKTTLQNMPKLDVKIEAEAQRLISVL